jgi:uridine kinase
MRLPGERRRGTPPVVVGVAGGSGSGKTSVVRAILEHLRPDRVGVLHHDAYYRDYAHLPPDTRATINFDHPDALETELLEAHVEALLRGESVAVPIYDFTTHTRTAETVPLDPTDVIIVDGILVFAEPRLRALMDIRIFVDTDPDLRFIRRLTRDMRERGRSLDSVVTQYLESVRPMHLDFVEPSRRWADLIIPEGGENRVAIDMVVAKLSAILDGAARGRTAPGASTDRTESRPGPPR